MYAFEFSQVSAAQVADARAFRASLYLEQLALPSTFMPEGAVPNAVARAWATYEGLCLSRCRDAVSCLVSRELPGAERAAELLTELEASMRRFSARARLDTLKAEAAMPSHALEQLVAFAVEGLLGVSAGELRLPRVDVALGSDATHQSLRIENASHPFLLGLQHPVSGVCLTAEAGAERLPTKVRLPGCWSWVPAETLASLTTWPELMATGVDELRAWQALGRVLLRWGQAGWGCVGVLRNWNTE